MLPCLDEADSVGLCVEEARAALSDAGLEGEVVVVDNGSEDDSAKVAAAAGARVVEEAQSGYGAALRAGFDAATGDVVVMADADNTYPLHRIPDLVAPVIAGDADMVVGARLDQATRRTMPFLHRFVGTPVLTFLVARACGRRLVSDSQSGFRAFRRSALDDLDLQSTGMELASEMLIRAAGAGLRVSEVDTGYRERIGESKLNTLSDGWRHLQLILLLAPDMLLLGPGVALFLVGVALSIVALVSPSGVEVGSVEWQPVFFSTIATVLGMQAVLAGAVLANRSSLARGSVHRRFAFVGRRAFPGQCLGLGLLTVVAGLGIDFVLFLRWVNGTEPPTTRSLGAAALAQTLLLLGGTLASFGLVGRFLYLRDARG